jgi:hypothetical protein
MHQDVPAEMRKLILDGFTASDRTKARVREFVLAYKRARTRASGPRNLPAIIGNQRTILGTTQYFGPDCLTRQHEHRREKAEAGSYGPLSRLACDETLMSGRGYTYIAPCLYPGYSFPLSF